MKIGVSVPNIGPVATPEAVKTVAQRAEALGYHSLWTVERLLWPVNPKLPYPVTPDGSLPEEYKYTLDPLDALTFAAAVTSKIRLGTSVLDMPYYNPILLARRLSTIDVLSKGRLIVGLGLGWSPDEMEAAGADMKVRGARADEFIQVLKTIWTTDPAEFHGKFFSLPKSHISAKPVQKPHPPVFIAAFYWGLIRERSVVRSLLSGRVADLLGRSSYAFYLIHFGFLRDVILFRLVRLAGVAGTTAEAWAAAFVKTPLGLFVVVNLLAILLYEAIESPANRILRRAFRTPPRAERAA